MIVPKTLHQSIGLGRGAGIKEVLFRAGSGQPIAALAGGDVKIVPRPLMRTLALLGDTPTRLMGRAFLINSSRYRSMITPYDTPMEPTFELLGENPYSLQDGIRETVDWLNADHGLDRIGGGA